MSEKKRTTVTTIETHEVWVIRSSCLNRLKKPVTITNVETGRPVTAVSPSRGFGGVSETSEEKEHEE
jgi:hypothetical protein